MIGRRSLYVTVLWSLWVGVALAAAPAASAQEGEHAEEEARAEHSESEGFSHFISFFGGLATHTDRGETGGAMGISYAYQLTHKWAVGVKLEYVTSSAERDVVALFGFAFEPVEHLEFAVAAGVERSEKESSEHGELQEEQESEGILRLTVARGFPLREGVVLAPEFNTDISASRVTLVYGLLFSVGL